jgi:hypothetical protein
VQIVYQSQYLSDAYAVQAALMARGVAAAVLGEHSIGTVGGGVTVQVASEAGARLARRLIPTLGLSAQGGHSTDRAV